MPMKSFFLFSFLLQFSTLSLNTQSLNAKTFSTEIEAKDAVLIDVRSKQEFNSGHISGALNIDFYSRDFDQKIKTSVANKKVYFYCASGNRSGQAMQQLKPLKIKVLHDLSGGVHAWSNAGFPIVK
jgi:rhodanese-related sulfurtransferase